jgi:predicted phage terminase large subunit-like protein
MSELGQRELRALLRADFCSFAMRSFLELNPRANFLANWHIEAMCAKMQAVRECRIKRLVVCIPPRHLKSLVASIALPAWWLGHDPSAAIINVTYGQDLSDKFARDCRTVMQASWYQQAFATRLTNTRAQLQELITSEGGYRMATSVGGVLTGRGADVILIDDSLKPSEALSDARRTAVNDWYDGALYSRLNDKQKGAIVVIMQRLHEDDLVGHVLRREGWDLLSFPAIAEVDEEHIVQTPFGRKPFTRKAGEALQPNREPLATLEEIRATLGAYNFAGQYQQTPAPSGGGMVKEVWFQRYDTTSAPKDFEQIIQSWDTANKPSELSDFSVCSTWGLKSGHFYLLNVLRKKLNFPDLKRAVIEQREMFNASVVIIEDKASGTQLLQELIEAGQSMATAFKPDGDKIMRLHAQTATIENGFVHIPREAHWLADYLHEMTVFPNGRHDDQVDSTSQALAWSKLRPPGWGILEYYRRETERMREPASGLTVR